VKIGLACAPPLFDGVLDQPWRCEVKIGADGQAVGNAVHVLDLLGGPVAVCRL
jgi:hypothetical protein